MPTGATANRPSAAAMMSRRVRADALTPKAILPDTTQRLLSPMRSRIGTKPITLNAAHAGTKARHDQVCAKLVHVEDNSMAAASAFDNERPDAMLAHVVQSQRVQLSQVKGSQQVGT